MAHWISFYNLRLFRFDSSRFRFRRLLCACFCFGSRLLGISALHRNRDNTSAANLWQYTQGTDRVRTSQRRDVRAALQTQVRVLKRVISRVSVKHFQHCEVAKKENYPVVRHLSAALIRHPEWWRVLRRFLWVGKRNWEKVRVNNLTPKRRKGNC